MKCVWCYKLLCLMATEMGRVTWLVTGCGRATYYVYDCQLNAISSSPVVALPTLNLASIDPPCSKIVAMGTSRLPIKLLFVPIGKVESTSNNSIMTLPCSLAGENSNHRVELWIEILVMYLGSVHDAILVHPCLVLTLAL